MAPTEKSVEAISRSQLTTVGREPHRAKLNFTHSRKACQLHQVPLRLLSIGSRAGRYTDRATRLD